MENRNRKLAASAVALVATLGIGSVVIGGGSPAAGTVDPSGVTVMMTIDRAGSTTDLGWGQSTSSVCNSALGGHAIELDSVTGGVDGGGSTTAPAKLQYRPVVILISTLDADHGRRLAVGLAAGYIRKDELSLATITELLD